MGPYAATEALAVSNIVSCICRQRRKRKKEVGEERVHFTYHLQQYHQKNTFEKKYQQETSQNDFFFGPTFCVIGIELAMVSKIKKIRFTFCMLGLGLDRERLIGSQPIALPIKPCSHITQMRVNKGSNEEICF